MLQSGGQSDSDNDNVVPSSDHSSNSTNFTQAAAPTRGTVHHPLPEFQQRPASYSPGHGTGTMVHWMKYPQQPRVPPSNGVTDNSEDEDDDDRPFTPPPPRERLSYTRHQLEMLNGIYDEVRYPNGTQKQLIAKRVGITREQVKIWFQNRRRKDVMIKTGQDTCTSKDGTIVTTADNLNSVSHATNIESGSAMTTGSGNSVSKCSGDPVCSESTGVPISDSNNMNTSTSNVGACGISVNEAEVSSDVASSPTSQPTMPVIKLVSPTIMRGMIAELKKFDNNYLRLKKSKKKKKKSKYSSHKSPAKPLPSCRFTRLFQNYDMVAPPNKVTPSAFLNTSVNKFKHAIGTSAFQNPRQIRLPITTNDRRLWEGFATNQSVSGIMDTSDYLQHRSAPDLVNSSLRSTMNLSSHSHFNNFHPVKGVSVPHPSIPMSQPAYCDNLPVLSDVLGSYTNHSASATAIAAATVHMNQEQSVLSSVSSGQPSLGTNIPGVYFHLPVGSSNTIGINGDSGKSLGSDISFPRSTSLSIYQPQGSTLTMNRVFPFPLVAEPPVMLSSNRHTDIFRHHSQWPHSASSQTSLPSSSLGNPITSNTTIGNLSEDHYRPLVISSLNNPYYIQQSSTYSLTSSMPSQTQLWPMQSNTGSESNSNSFTQM